MLVSNGYSFGSARVVISAAGNTAHLVMPPDQDEDHPPPLAVASTAPSTSSSPSIAQALYAVETLVQVFGFPPDVANLAVNVVGVDVTACYNYILDQNLGADTGGAVYPIDTCPHVKAVVVSETDPKQWSPEIFDRACQYRERDKDGNKQGKLKQEFDNNDNHDDGERTYTQQGPQHLTCPKGENWWCLTCHGVFCSRYVNGHGLEHWNDTKNERRDDKMETQAIGNKTEQLVGHSVAVSLADLSVWCHECGAYLVHDQNILKPIVLRLEELKFQQEP